MARKKRPANVVGQQIRKRRNALGWTQEEMAAQCQLCGLDLGRGSLSQIEAAIRGVRDFELIKLASVLGVRTDELFSDGSKQLEPKKKSPFAT